MCKENTKQVKEIIKVSPLYALNIIQREIKRGYL